MIYKQDYFGFVYIWRDRKRSKYYIGSHFGSKNDSYICGNGRMLKAYRARPEDFRRRVLYWLPEPHRKFLLLMEQRWLNLIPDADLSARYYNHVKDALGGARSGHKLTEEHKKKIGDGNRKPHQSKRAKEADKRHSKRLKGRVASEVTKQKMSAAGLGKKWTPERHASWRAIKRVGWNKGGTWTEAQRAGRERKAKEKLHASPLQSSNLVGTPDWVSPVIAPL